MKYRFIGTHADTVYKGNEDEPANVPVAPGDFIVLSEKDKALQDNKYLFDDGLLMEVKDK